MRPYRSFFIENNTNRLHSKMTLEQRLKNVIRENNIPHAQKEKESKSHHLQQIFIFNITTQVDIDKTISTIMRSISQIL